MRLNSGGILPWRSPENFSENGAFLAAQILHGPWELFSIDLTLRKTLEVNHPS